MFGIRRHFDDVDASCRNCVRLAFYDSHAFVPRSACAAALLFSRAASSRLCLSQSDSYRKIIKNRDFFKKGVDKRYVRAYNTTNIPSRWVKRRVSK